MTYWHNEWRNIWLGENGYLQTILDLGFDGVYLDWVEAYSDETIVAAAQQEGVDPRQEMIWWVGDIAEFTRSQQPNFIVIGQNAAELTADDGRFIASIPELLFTSDHWLNSNFIGSAGAGNHSVSTDGHRFLMLTPVAEDSEGRVTIDTNLVLVDNLAAELVRCVPANAQ